jgi:hypothetical protein
MRWNMRVIQVDCGAGPTTLKLGLQGENEVTAVEFDLAAFVTEFGSGQPVLYVRRCADESPYLSELSVDGTKATWTVTGADTAKSGHGKAQLAYYVGEQIAKTVVYTTYVAPSVEQGDVPPDPYESYLERMAEIGAQVAASVEQAQTILEEMTELLENHNGITYKE